MKNAIILANGAFPRRKEALDALLHIPLLICCDGAYNRLDESGLFTHAKTLPEVHVVGDGDSLESRFNSAPPIPATFVSGYVDQETNDLTKTVKYAISLGIEKLIILGATGLREDHTLGNISLLALYASMTTLSGKPLSVRIYTDYGFFTPLVSSTDVVSFPHQQVSLFNLTPSIAITAVGLKFPIIHRRFANLWEATLNEAIADNFHVELEGDGVVLVYQTHLPK